MIHVGWKPAIPDIVNICAKLIWSKYGAKKATKNVFEILKIVQASKNVLIFLAVNVGLGVKQLENVKCY